MKNRSQDILEVFESIDKSDDQTINIEQIADSLNKLNMGISKKELDDLVPKFDVNNDGLIDFNEFKELFTHIYGQKIGIRSSSSIDCLVNYVESANLKSTEGTVHSFTEDEKLGFLDWINISLKNDPDLNSKLPISEKGNCLFEACHDGILLSKLINFSIPNTIDERALNKKNLNLFKIHENQSLCINSARAIGCNITNIGAEDLISGTPHLCLGLTWQIIRLGLLAQVDLQHCKGLARLLHEGETIEQLMSLPAEKILLRWFNYHLSNAGHPRTVHNFSEDIKDSECYTILLSQISPKELNIDTSPLHEKNLTVRAEKMLKNAEKMDCKRFVKPTDVVKGNPKLNLAFVANLFNKFPALEDVEIEIIEETREEKTFRNWMNSLGVSSFVNNLYEDLADGLIILELFDKVYPGIVKWTTKPVNYPPYKEIGGNMKKLENCNYAIFLGLEKKFSLVGIEGNDILNKKKTFALALIWQLMRAYTLEILKKLSGSDKPITDNDIVEWVNSTLKKEGKSSSILNFKDSSICDSLPILDLIDCLKPNSVDYSIVIKKAKSQKDQMNNATYAISMARKIGAGVYALPEDIVEGNSKMVMTIFACLMSCSYLKKI